jgi:nucleoside-diphosphate-sugar epimerase
MRRGRKIVIHGDGTSLWALTHHEDFAAGFTGLLGNPAAIGEAFHITTDETLTWNQIYASLARAAGVDGPPKAVHISSGLIAAYFADWGDSLLGDKSHSMIFDNSKIKRFVPGFRAAIPFWRGAEEILAWHDADAGRRIVDEEFNRRLDRMIAAHEAAFPGT